MRRFLFAVGFVSTVTSALGCRRSGRNEPPPEATGSGTSAGFAGERHCFEAVGDGAQPAQSVFEAMGRSGNGETWLAILEHAVKRRAKLGPVVSVSSMGFGVQFAAEIENRRTWVGFDAEAGGAVFCTGDAALLASMQRLYEEARREPDVLRQLIASVPASAWDD